MPGIAGVTVMDTSAAGVTVNCVLSLSVPTVAVMVVLPVPAELARPCEPAALLMVATALADELQVAVVVRFCVVLSV